jgi:hypothetical protein
MNASQMNNPERPYPWNDVPLFLEKIERLGWIRAAGHVTYDVGGGICAIDFTPEGEAALKPFADIWRNAGPLTEAQALALFNIAILAHPIKPE